ncbi:heptaprenyl diphosphate synthase component 1 [Paenibacillus pinistramenti]|uniref:heptaprenyl diphosphate synthase component 1 n=1 Tax=Paenibacillus pinistramenti TaxID=1768003 RepID=UPI001107F4E8|nr:heptaprenyl diphosphate synthase component 1 [Paenibacillus pinistramenti]
MKLYRVPDLAKKYVDYDMISTHTELADFPDSRVRLLYTFLKHQQPDNENESLLEVCALAVYLLQLGLDTHDLIDPEPVRKEEKLMRSRQLKVLAGDYFSSLFYQLLAKSGQIQHISLLSSAVCEVNRLKARFYTKMKDLLLSAEDYVKESALVKMQLFAFFTPLLDKSAQPFWRPLLAEISKCEALAAEMSLTAREPMSHKGFAYLRILESGSDEDKAVLGRSKLNAREWSTLLLKYKVIEQLADKLHQSVEQIQLLLQDMAGERFSKELAEIAEPFKALLSKPRTAWNEG